MAIPLAVAGPAALLAGGAWLTAKTNLDYDLKLLMGLTRAEWDIQRREKADRLNFFYLLEEHASNKSSADRPFLMYEGQSWTYKESYDIVLRYGAWLKKTHKVEKGEVVCIVLMNSPTFIFLWLGIWSIGALPAFINYNLTADPLVHSLTVSGARVAVVDVDVRKNFSSEVMSALAAKTNSGRQPMSIVFLEKHVEQDILSTPPHREPDSIRGGNKRRDMTLLIYTSGTTGLPKPAILSLTKFFLASKFFTHWLSMTVNDRYYTVRSRYILKHVSDTILTKCQCMPLYHTSAALLGFGPTLVRGSTLIIGRRFSTAKFWPEVRQHQATIIQYVGETLRYLLAAPPQRDPTSGEDLDRAHYVRAAFGNGLRPDVWERFKDRFGIETIGEFYGSTEGPGALWNLSSNTHTSGAIGRNGSLAGLGLKKETAIVAVDWDTEAPARDPKNHDFCIPVKSNEPGEMLQRIDANDPKAKFAGYFKNSDATEKKILRDVLVKGDAYFRTGDVVRWDSEGRWWFCDRIGDTFRWKSENVSTAQVSEVLGAHPRILEANVYGVAVPHHDGRIGCAALVFDNGDGLQKAPGGGVADVSVSILEDLANHARSRLPSYAVPGFLRVVNEMEATGNNKQQKTGLRKQGVDPAAAGGDKLFWLRGGKYVPFGPSEWEKLNGGGVRL